MIELLHFMFEFFKTGLFAIGGGLATLPFLYAIGNKTGWFTSADVADMIAISESTPGPIGINMATYVGFTSFGLPGALLGPIAMVVPSVIIIIAISKVLQKFKESKTVQDVFYGLRPASAGLIIAAGLGVAKIVFLHTELFQVNANILEWLNYKTILLAVGLHIFMKKAEVHPVAVIGIAAVVGILFQL
uniref:chromate transporter n=1 Tax=Agathobacter sp. TaxID=2021311 RepID=UPI004057742E